MAYMAVVTKHQVFERKQQSGSEDSPTMDARLLDNFISENPKARIVSVFHSGVKHLFIVYEIDTDDMPKPQHKAALGVTEPLLPNQ